MISLVALKDAVKDFPRYVRHNLRKNEVAVVHTCSRLRDAYTDFNTNLDPSLGHKKRVFAYKSNS